MRAGLIAAAFAAAAAAAPAPAAAQAPVPCTNIGGGKYECGWYIPGDGIHGGALVVVGTTTVGFLHQGRNWIVCQQQGGDVHNSAGDRNHWYGWTMADNDRWGWASALEAQGGADYGPFGGGTPNCNGAHGTPPSYNGQWGSPPTPPPPPSTPQPTDADRDKVSPPVDCDDTNSRVYPGAPEVPSDGIDQDCNGVDAAGRVGGVVAIRYRYSRRFTRVTRLRVTEAPPGATVSVSCRGGKRKRCPKHNRTFVTNAKGKASMTRMFRKRRLRPGARIEVAISAPNTIAKIKRYRIRRGKAPRLRTYCQAPGAKRTRC